MNMKTNEFIKEVEAMGFNAEEYPQWVVIYANGFRISTVSKNRLFVVNTDFVKFYDLFKDKKQQLFNLLTQYASMPIEEREEEKKYMYLIKEVDGINLEIHQDREAYLNYSAENKGWFLSDNEHDQYFQTQFTHSWLKERGIDIDQLKEVYDEIEVEED